MWSLFRGVAALWCYVTEGPAAKQQTAKKAAQKLYEEAVAAHAPITINRFLEYILQGSINRQFLDLPESVQETFMGLTMSVYNDEAFGREIPRPPTLCDSIEGARYLDRLASFGAATEDTAQIAADALRSVLSAYIAHVPRFDRGGEFSVSIADAIQNKNELVERLALPFYEPEAIQSGVLRTMRDILDRNMHEVSNVPLADRASHKLITPIHYTKDDAPQRYLRGTVLLEFFDLRVPFGIPDQVWFEHAHCVGGSGAGKTQLLSQLFLSLYKKGAVVCVDSQGDWMGKLSRLKAIQDRVLYIDPRNPPTVNLFKADILDYLFSVKGQTLTPKQHIFFSMLTRLMRIVPNATMMDVLKALNDIKPYSQHVAKLPEIQQLFFERDYDSKTFTQTKEEVRYRINSLIEHPTMERLFTSSDEAVDIGAELDKGRIILIDTSLDYLKAASSAFGKIFIALMLEAVKERASTPESERRPAYFLCDEAAAYFDQNITDLLEMARKYKLACVFAHQQLAQCTPELRASLMGNTSIKMATQNAVDDARALAPNMRTTQDFILAQPKLTFATYIRGTTPNAVAIQVTPGLLEREPTVERHEPSPRTAHDDATAHEAEASPPQSTTEPPEDDVTAASDTW